MKKVINSPKAPKAIGPYSQAIERNDLYQRSAARRRKYR